METLKSKDPGQLAGQQRAFAKVAGNCMSFQAESLKKARDSKTAASLGLTWEQYCLQCYGLTRSQADRIIRQHDKLGDISFLLAGIAGISARTFERLVRAGHVVGNRFVFNGQTLVIGSDDAPAIRIAMRALYAQWRREDPLRPASRRAPVPRPSPDPQLPARRPTSVIDIQELLIAWHRAAYAGDHALFVSFLADNFRYLGRTPRERYNLAQFRDLTARERGAPIWTLDVADRQVAISADGSVAWFDELLISSSACWHRGAGVLQRIGDTWKLVQYNRYVPVPDSLHGAIRERIKAEAA